jgi:hypothetical protein
MNKEFKQRVDLSINNVRHVCDHGAVSMGAPLPAGIEIIYLLEKIEELQYQIDELKVKRKVK